MKRKKSTFDIDPALHLKFKVDCTKRGKSMTKVLEEFMTTYIRQSRRKQEGKETPQ